MARRSTFEERSDNAFGRRGFLAAASVAGCGIAAGVSGTARALGLVPGRDLYVVPFGTDGDPRVWRREFARLSANSVNVAFLESTNRSEPQWLTEAAHVFGRSAVPVVPLSWLQAYGDAAPFNRAVATLGYGSGAGIRAQLAGGHREILLLVDRCASQVVENGDLGTAAPSRGTYSVRFYDGQDPAAMPAFLTSWRWHDC